MKVYYVRAHTPILRVSAKKKHCKGGHDYENERWISGKEFIEKFMIEYVTGIDNKIIKE